MGSKSADIPAEIVHQFGFLAGPLTLLPGFISIGFYSRYRIDAERHAEIRSALEKRSRSQLESLVNLA